MRYETTPITGTEDVLDSRDVEARIEFLESAEVLDDDEAQELEGLKSFRDELAGYVPDWSYGEALINEDYFEDYARELAEDIGAIDRDASWPLSYIDWPAAAEALLIDYTSAELFGRTYYAR